MNIIIIIMGNQGLSHHRRHGGGRLEAKKGGIARKLGGFWEKETTTVKHAREMLGEK
jgi:hypothetical protein